AAMGCGAPQGTEVKNTSTQTAKLLWQVKSSATYRELATWAVGEFRKTHPNVTIDLMGDEGNVEKTTATMVAGEGPDVIHAWGNLLWQFAAKGQMYNHNELIRDMKKSDLDDFAPSQWNSFVIPGTSFRYGMPQYINMGIVYYNKALFQKRGQKEPTVDWTHDDYQAMLRQMTFQDGDKKVWGGHMPASSYDRFQAHVLAFGGHVVDPKNLAKSALDTKEAQQALDWMRARFHQDQTMAPEDAAKRTWQPTSPQDGFEQGVLATMEAALGSVFLRAAKNAANLNWELAHIPKGPAKRAALGTTDGWALWKGTKYKDVSWELIKFATTNAFCDMQSKIEGRVPSRKSAMDNWVKIVREQFPSTQSVNLKVVTDALTTLNYPVVDESFICQSEALPVLQPALNEVFKNGASVTMFRDIKPQLDDAAGRCGLDPAKVFK
ncbi:MAG TPA: extracellular solute-binding protein, partial [Chloroflexota bacterium]|nr:extracellular solute-binding protein [Chloroflexota bacterium]